MALSKEQILGTTPKMTPFEVPEWGGEVYIRPLSVAQFDRFMEAREKGESPGATLALLASMGVCDEDGKRLFSTTADIAGLDIETITRIGNEVLKVSKLTTEDQPPNPE